MEEVRRHLTKLMGEIKVEVFIIKKGNIKVK